MARPSPGTAPFQTDPLTELHLKLQPILPFFPQNDRGPFQDTAAQDDVFWHHAAHSSSVLLQSPPGAWQGAWGREGFHCVPMSLLFNTVQLLAELYGLGGTCAEAAASKRATVALGLGSSSSKAASGRVPMMLKREMRAA